MPRARKKAGKAKTKPTKAGVTARNMAEHGSLIAELFAGDPRVDGRLLAAFEKAVAKFGHRPEVTGIDIGYRMEGGRHTQRMAVRVHIREKFAPSQLDSRSLFPENVDGIPLDVIEAVYVPSGGGAAPVVPLAPTSATLRPGLSVGLANRRPTGTIGVIARNPQTAENCLVSAAHVIAEGDETRPGDAVIQPGREDGGLGPRDTVATLGRINFASDAAFAVLDGNRNVDGRAAVSNVMIQETRFPQLDDVLEKSGRTTGVTRARIDGIGHFFGLQFAFRLVPLAGQMAPIAQEGDSGAVWYDPATGQGVGLHSRGGLLPVSTLNFAVATSLKKLLDSWGLVT